MRLIDEGRIEALFESEVREIGHDSVLLTTPQGERELPNDAVIIQIGGVPPFEMLRRLGIAFGGDAVTIREADSRYAGAAIAAPG